MDDKQCRYIDMSSMETQLGASTFQSLLLRFKSYG